MIKWITREQAEKHGEGTQLEAAQCSWERWNQATTCGRDELTLGMLNGEAVFGGQGCGKYCALCIYSNNNYGKEKCLRDCVKGARVCCEEYASASGAYRDFCSDTSRQNCDTFQTKAKALCGVIQKFMDGLEPKKEELRIGHYGIAHGKPFLVQDGADHVLEVKYKDGIGTPTWSGVKYAQDANDLVILGNTFDHIDCNAEDLESFETDVHLYKINFKNFPHAPILIAGNWHTIAEAIEHHQKFGQMLATALRDERKKK